MSSRFYRRLTSTPYSGTPSNRVQNGLLLRADIHDLFGRGLLWITDAMRVAVAPALSASR